MAWPTLATADAWLSNLLAETGTGGVFGTAQRYRAIYMVVNRIQWRTRQYVRSTNVTLSNGTTSYDLAGASATNDDNFTCDRIIRMGIGNYPALQQYVSEDVVRDKLRGESTGRPDGYYPIQPSTILLDKDPDQNYTLVVRDFPEITIDFAEASPGDVDIELPAAWVYGGLDAGAWHYMNRTSAEGYSTVANAEFERFIDGLGALDVHPMAVRPHDPYGVTGTELMHGHLEG